MSKVAAAVGLLATGAVSTAGAVYLYQMRSGFDSLLPKTVNDFENKGHEEGCVQSLFAGLEKLNSTSSTDTSNIDGTFLGNSESDKKNSEGCLVINWNKEKYGSGDSQKWKGDFRLLWSVKNVVKIPDNKEVEFKDKFPKPKLTTQAFWGFVNEENDISSKICGDSDCSDKSNQQDESFQSYWSWTGGENDSGKQKLGEWTDKLEEWWKDTFGDDKWKMKEVVKDIGGQWTQKV